MRSAEASLTEQVDEKFHVQAIDVMARLLHLAAQWRRIERRLKRDFDEAIALSRDLSNASVQYLDALFSGPGNEASSESILIGQLRDEFDDLAAISSAVVLLMLDEHIRRVCLGVGKTTVIPSGPKVGHNVKSQVRFSDLVWAGANSFRHLHNWQPSIVKTLRPAPESPTEAKKDAAEHQKAESSLKIIRAALHQSENDLHGFPTLEILKALALDASTYRSEWDLLRQRFFETVREIVYDAGHSDSYMGAWGHNPDVLLPPL